ncbi:MAG: NTP transferase domain-containing protein [Bacteroidota bacterium]
MILADSLYGLVLSGGQSSRMGRDKGLITYYDKPQREYLYQLLDALCQKTFMSVRSEQRDKIPSKFNVILDEDKFRGPFNGLLSAHLQFPKAAWLVLACDLPLIDSIALRRLISERDITAMATAYALKDNPLPEPLCAIWEPESLVRAKTYLEDGKGSCPRKFLIHSRIKLVFPKNPQVLLNANSHEEYRMALEKLAIS